MISYQKHHCVSPHCPSLPSPLSPFPHATGAIFVIDSHHSLKWLDGVVQRMCAMSDDHQLQSLVGMPLVILALGEEFMNENSVEAKRVIEVTNR